MSAEGYRPDELPAAVSDTDTRNLDCQLFGHRWVDDFPTCTHRCGAPRPDPETTRTAPLGLRDTGAALVGPLLLGLILSAFLVLAFVEGEQRRCQTLLASGDPAAVRYSCAEGEGR